MAGHCGSCGGGGSRTPSSTRTLTKSGSRKTTAYEVKFPDGTKKMYTARVEAEAARAKFGGTLTTKTS